MQRLRELERADGAEGPHRHVVRLRVLEVLEARERGTEERSVRGAELGDLGATTVTDGLAQRLVRGSGRVAVKVGVAQRLVVRGGDLPKSP